MAFIKYKLQGQKSIYLWNVFIYLFLEKNTWPHMAEVILAVGLGSFWPHSQEV